MMEIRRIREGTRRRYACMDCLHRETLYEVSADVYKELREAKRSLQLFTSLFMAYQQRNIKESKDTIPCERCVHLGERGCDLEIPEALTSGASGCSAFFNPKPEESLQE